MRTGFYTNVDLVEGGLKSSPRTFPRIFENSVHTNLSSEHRIVSDLAELRSLYSALVRYLRDNQRRARQRVRTNAERGRDRAIVVTHRPSAEDIARVRKKLMRTRAKR
jgi:hypothetical protein